MRVSELPGDDYIIQIDGFRIECRRLNSNDVVYFAELDDLPEAWKKVFLALKQRDEVCHAVLRLLGPDLRVIGQYFYELPDGGNTMPEHRGEIMGGPVESLLLAADVD